MKKRVYSFLLAACVALSCPAAPAAPQGEAKNEIQRLLDQGRSLRNLSRPNEALKPLTAALARAEKELGRDDPRTADVMVSLAHAHLDLAHYPQAESLLRRALEVFEAKLKPNHQAVANTVNDLAYVYMESAQYAKAESLFLRCLKIAEASGKQKTPEYATMLNNLGSLYERTGQSLKAESYYLRCLSLRESTLGKGHSQVGQTCNNLGLLYHNMGLLPKAEHYYSRALNTLERTLGKDHADLAVIQSNLASLYSTTGRFDKAEPLLQSALSIKERALGKKHPGVAQTLNNLASLYHDQGQYSRAEPLYRRSLDIWTERLGPDHPEVATALNNLSGLYRDSKQYEKAAPPLQRCLEIKVARLGKDHPEVAETFSNLGLLEVKRGRFDEAARAYQRSREINRRHASLVLPSLPPDEQAAFLDRFDRSDLAGSLSFCLAHPRVAGLPERAATWLLNGKAAAAEALARSALLTRDSHDPAIGKVASRLREARDALARLSLTTPPAGQEGEHRRRVAELTAREQQLARQAAAAGGSAAVAASWYDLDALRKRLPAGAVFLDVARIDVFDFQAPLDKRWKPARYVAWVTPARGDVRIVDLGDAEAIDAAVREVRRGLAGSAKLIRGKGEPQAEQALRGPLEVLSKLVLQPLLPHVGTANRWVVSPDGNLWLIPWEILLLPDGKYAVESHALSYVVSGRDLLLDSPFKGSLTAPVIVADPDFDLGGNAAGAAGL
jgi:tetratricopeptide (TPR) repeat protein